MKIITSLNKRINSYILGTERTDLISYFNQEILGSALEKGIQSRTINGQGASVYSIRILITCKFVHRNVSVHEN